MIRFILVILTAFLYLILSIPVLLVLLLIRKKKPEVCDKVSRSLIRWIFRVILFFSGTKITVKGQENIPKDRAVLYIGNHRSYFDIVMTYVRVPRTTGYISKVEFLKIPLLSNWMKNLHCLFLDRSDLKAGMKTFLAAIEEIKNGVSICIFPEGTRNNGEELSMLPFRDGALKIAEKTGCAIIPISMNNTADIFEAHFPRVKKVHVVIEYGKPIYPKELDKETRKHLGIYCHDLIQDTIKKNASLI